MQTNNIFKCRNHEVIMPRDIDEVTPLVNYIEKNLKKGYKLEELKWALTTQKHSRIEIEKAISRTF